MSSSSCSVISSVSRSLEDHKSKKPKKGPFVALRKPQEVEDIIKIWSCNVVISKFLISTCRSRAIQVCKANSSQIISLPEFNSRSFLVDPVIGFNALVLKSEADKHSLIGRGSSKDVYPGVDVFTGEQYAVALIKKEGPNVCLKIQILSGNNVEPVVNLTIHVLDRYNTKKTTLQEVEVLKKVAHLDRVIHFKTIFSSSLEPFDFLVTDLYSKQNLEDRIFSLLPISSREKEIVTIDCIKGLSDIHELGIIHQDLKPSSIFFLVDNNTTLIAKAVIGDFGFAMMKSGSFKKNFCATWCYLSPERWKIINNESASEWEALGEKNDVWSMGVTLYELWRINRFIKNPATIKKLTDPLIESSINSSYLIAEKIKPLLIGMLKINPEERWSARQARDYIQSLT